MKELLRNSVVYLCLLLIFEAHSQNMVVKPGSSIIETGNGEPFLWIGDTAWDLFRKLSKEEAIFYLNNRAEKGFSVIQAVVLPMGSAAQSNFYGEKAFTAEGPAKPNEKYFEYIDFVVQEVKKRGMFMGLLPTWANNVVNRSGKGAYFNTETARAYGKFLANRYKDSPVVWILGGDRNVHTDDEFEIWNAMAQGLQEGDGGRNLISYHPTAPISSHYWFHDEPWLSFNIIQTGHFKKFHTVYEFGEVFQQVLPIKPYVNAEPAYEDIAVLFWHYNDYAKFGKKKEDVIGEDGLIKDKGFYPHGFFDDYDVRMEAYWTFFAGGAGYTYGNNAIWQMYKPGARYAVPCLTFWDGALDRPGADDMRHVKKLFTDFPLGSFHIDQSVVYGTNFTDENNIRSIVADDQSFILLYLNKGQNVSVNAAKLARPGTAFWFDPREGTMEKIQSIDNKGIHSFDPPGEFGQAGNDWILILKAG
jgi:hypothetical protein